MESLRQDPEIIDVKVAAQTALEYVKKLYESEEIRNLGLEEVKLSEDAETWTITVGFSRPWSQDQVEPSPFSTIATHPFQPRFPLERDYKEVHIDTHSGDVRGMEIRKL